MNAELKLPIQDPCPQPPEPPLASDCCNGGCDPCVYDSHAEEMDAYRRELAAWRQRHPQAQAGG